MKTETAQSVRAVPFLLHSYNKEIFKVRVLHSGYAKAYGPDGRRVLPGTLHTA